MCPSAEVGGGEASKAWQAEVQMLRRGRQRACWQRRSCLLPRTGLPSRVPGPITQRIPCPRARLPPPPTHTHTTTHPYRPL
jgi:hypothetical protein